MTTPLTDPSCTLQFVATLESNILTAIEQLVNVTITKVVAGSISVSTSIAFTTADAAAALEGQSALAAVLQSNDVSSIFGDSFGDVTVTGVSKGNTTNPSKPPPAFFMHFSNSVQSCNGHHRCECAS